MIELPFELLNQEEKKEALQHWKYRHGNAVILFMKWQGKECLVKVNDVPVNDFAR